LHRLRTRSYCLLEEALKGPKGEEEPYAGQLPALGGGPGLLTELPY